MSDPLLLRELRLSARRPGHFVLRAAAVAALAAAVWASGSAAGTISPRQTASEFAAIGRALFEVLAWVVFASATLAALAAGAEGLVRERLAGTLGLLVLTPLGEARLLQAKWRASMVQAAVATLAAAPALAGCAFLGGVGPWRIAPALLAALGSAALAGACGLRASIFSDSVAGALLRATLLYAGWALVPLLLVLPTFGLGLLAAVFGHPLWAALARAELFPLPDGAELAALTSAGVSLFVALSSLRASAGKLSRRLREAPDPEHPLPEPTSGPAASLLSWIPGRARREGVWDDAPLLWKDLATRAAARMPGEGRFAIHVLLPVAAYLILLVDQGRRLEALGLMGALFAGAALLLGATLFAPERERGTLDLLLAAPLGAPRIVGAKLLSGPASPEALLLVVFAGLVTAVYGSRAEAPGGFAMTAAVSALFLLTAYLAGAAASLVAPGTGAAFVQACSGLLALLVLAGTLPSLRILDPLRPLSEARSGSPGALRSFGGFALAYGGLSAGLLGLLLARLRR